MRGEIDGDSAIEGEMGRKHVKSWRVKEKKGRAREGEVEEDMRGTEIRITAVDEPVSRERKRSRFESQLRQSA